MTKYHSHNEAAEMGRPVKHRRRPPLSCTECRRRKLKCDRSLPCGQCVRSKTADLCNYAAPQPVSRRRLPSGSEEPSAGTSSGGMLVFDSKLGPKSSSDRVCKRGHPDELQDLRQRLRMLENALGNPNGLCTYDTSVCDVYPEVGTFQQGSDTAGVDDRMRFLPDCSFRGKKGKTKYFGRSHYSTTTSFFQDIGQFLQRGRNNVKDQECIDMKKLRGEFWARESQENQRVLPEQAFKLEEMMPPRNVADQLLQLYLDTFETTFRILHIPTFLKQYTDYWTNNQKPDMAFVAQLLAAMAAGSCFYVASTEQDDRDTYKKTAMKWIMAVQSYISCTSVSLTVDLRMIQTQCLLLVARLGVASDGDVVWASSGSLVRSAMIMGLHRDPARFSKTVRPFWCELRRRIWATIVEIDLKISLDRGVTPSVDLDECDCDAPSNWDDNDLFEDMEHSPSSISATAHTQNFYQTLLAKTLAVRYRISKKINALKFDLSYDEAIRMSEELLRSIQNASSIFEDHASSINSANIPCHRFAQSLHLFIVRKFILALHRPFSFSAARLPKYSYSRKICLEVSLEMLSQMELPSSPDRIMYPHITQLGSGMFRDETFHAAITVCVELAIQSQEMSQSSGLSMEGVNCSVLMSMVQSQQSLMLQAVERTMHDFGRRAIGPSGKGCKKLYFFLCMILTSVKSRLKGEDPMAEVEAASKKAMRLGRIMLNGVPYADALVIADRQSSQTPTPAPSQLTSGSGSPNDFDLPFLLSTDFGEFTSLDLGGWFDGLGSGMSMMDP